MILALNIIVPIVVILFLWLALRLKSGYPVIAALVFVVMYQLFQPSYMPKGTVKPMSKVEFQQVNTPIVDRGLKTKSSEQYDIERQQAFDAIDKSIKNQIKLNKE
jgi:hypothetical protein